MRVVFTGISGTGERHVVRRLADYIRTQHGHSVAVIEAEQQLRALGPDEYYEFLEAIPGHKASRQWSDSIKAALSKWKQENRKNGEATFSFLSMHLVFQVRSHFHCPINWSFPNPSTASLWATTHTAGFAVSERV